MTTQRDQITERTSLPFKIVIPIITTLVVCSWAVSAKLTTIESSIKQSWTVQDQQNWAAKLARENLNIIVPDVSTR